MIKYYLGIDVGSTTVKCVLIKAEGMKILWKSYRRHETKQAEKTHELITDCFIAHPEATAPNVLQVFMTGSGAAPLCQAFNATFVQEVNAVALCVSHLHPEARSVVELGGQDAKIILYKINPESNERQIITSMNDKCASGTGATIDKCLIKVGLENQDLSKIVYDPEKIHNVAAKCGVFAETDIVNLVKSSIPSNEIINSLADAIVMQNLSVLTRGNTLEAKVVLLGGPNAYLPFLQACWRYRIPQTWEERGYTSPDLPLDELIIVPDNAEYYAAYGSVIFGSKESKDQKCFEDLSQLEKYMSSGRTERLASMSGKALANSGTDINEFIAEYKKPPFKEKQYPQGYTISAYLGIDGGSTTSKAVLIDSKKNVIFKTYLMSKGNPIQDTKDIVELVTDYANKQQCHLNILGCGVTGYAGDILTKALHCDANIVETVAHTMSSLEYCGDDIDVICDIGGQDIKVIFLKNGKINNFKLSNQCSAGNGMLLQAMAAQFGVDVKEYADYAFKAEISPEFSYGCAVFLDTDRVNFQKEGFNRNELFSGLALVLPKNIWQYVAQISRLAKLGNHFVLQGGTQYNLAALKAQVDYIKERVPDAKVSVHPHCGEGGALGAALEAMRVVKRKKRSTFIGIEHTQNLEYTSLTDETTRCNFCENNCSRTFIDIQVEAQEKARYIAGFSCEKGTVESKQEVIKINKQRKLLQQQYPNLLATEASLVFSKKYKPQPMPTEQDMVEKISVKQTLFGFGPIKQIKVNRHFEKASEEIYEHRKTLRIGIPKALNVYTVAPFLRTYLSTLGIDDRNIIFSDETSEELWSTGGKFGSIDPCFPSKVSLAHIYNLLKAKQRHKPLNAIWFPTITHVQNFMTHTMANTSCPIVAGTPCVAKAAFTKEKDYFKESNLEYVDLPLNFDDSESLKQQLFASWGKLLSLTQDESDFAMQQAIKAMTYTDKLLQSQGMEILKHAEANNKVVLLVLCRPYHASPGLNHEIIEEFQALGYPILSIRSIPKDRDYLRPYFLSDLNEKIIEDVFDIRDVWPENYSINSAQKVWAAKFAARHPNVAVVDFSSFKCGHDAPTYGIIDNIISTSQTPYFAFHDLDANKPSGSLNIRVKTFSYTLSRFQEDIEDENTCCNFNPYIRETHANC